MLVCSSNWATNCSRDNDGAGGGMNLHRNANAAAQLKIITGPHHTQIFCAVMFMFRIMVSFQASAAIAVWAANRPHQPLTVPPGWDPAPAR